MEDPPSERLRNGTMDRGLMAAFHSVPNPETLPLNCLARSFKWACASHSVREPWRALNGLEQKLRIWPRGSPHLPVARSFCCHLAPSPRHLVTLFPSSPRRPVTWSSPFWL